jgi:serine/threonine-protein kinase HipA
MRLAERVGIQVPVVDYRYVPEPVYIIERFDRAGTIPYRRGTGLR